MYNKLTNCGRGWEVLGLTLDSEYVDVKYEGVGVLYCLHSLVK
jgi:hypothetical protein